MYTMLVDTSVVHKNGFGVEIISNSSKRVKLEGYDYFSLNHNSEYSIELSNFTPTRCDVMVFVDSEQIGKWRIDALSKIKIERPVDCSRKLTFVKEKSDIAASTGVVAGKEKNGAIVVIFMPEKKQYTNNWSRSVNSSSMDYNADFDMLSQMDCNIGSTCNDTYGNRGGVNHTVKEKIKNCIDDRKMCAKKRTIVPNSAPRTESAGDYTLSYGREANPNDYASGATVLGRESNQTFRSASPIRQYNEYVTIEVRLIANKEDRPQFISLEKDKRSPPRIEAFQ